MCDALLEYAFSGVSEFESLLLLDVPVTIWPTEVSFVYS